MAHEIQASGQSGLALQARLIQGLSQIGANVTLTEVSGLSGYYTGNVPGGVPAGAYVVQYLNGGVVTASATLQWDGAAELLPSSAGVPVTLTAGERTAVATEVESRIINDADGQAVKAALVTAIGNLNVDEAVLVAAIRADIERGGGMLATRPTLAEIEASTVLAKESTSAAIKAKTDGLPAAPASVSDIPLAATVASAVRTDLAVELARIDVAVSTRESDVDALARATADIAEHDATQAALASISVPSAAAVAAAVRVDQAVELARIDVAVSTREAESDALARAVTNIAEHDATQAAIGSGSGPVQADVRLINGVPIQGGGVAGNKWRPA